MDIVCKGTNAHPPKKFIHDQFVCQACILVFIVSSITMSSISAGMDDGGNFPYPYFFTGFVLGFINIIWPWSSRLGLVWCVSGSIITGLGGINCGIQEENGITTVKNKCYFDVEGEKSDLYRGLAIGLVIMHMYSFVYLIFSSCPVQNVLEQIKIDPKPTTRNVAVPAAQSSVV